MPFTMDKATRLLNIVGTLSTSFSFRYFEVYFEVKTIQLVIPKYA